MNKLIRIAADNKSHEVKEYGDKEYAEQIREVEVQIDQGVSPAEAIRVRPDVLPWAKNVAALILTKCIKEIKNDNIS